MEVFHFSLSNSSLFVIAAGHTIGLYFDGNVCYTFDYDAQNEYGLGYPVGKCVLVGLHNIVDLCS